MARRRTKRNRNPSWGTTLAVGAIGAAGGYAAHAITSDADNYVRKQLAIAKEAVANKRWKKASRALKKAELKIYPGIAARTLSQLQALNRQLPEQHQANLNPIDMPGGSVTGCIKKVKRRKDIRDPGAYCAAIADKIEPGWREGNPRTWKREPTEDDIKYETEHFWVLDVGPRGYEVYRSGLTHSTRVASIGPGRGPRLGLERAIAEADRRERLLAGQVGENSGVANVTVRKGMF